MTRPRWREVLETPGVERHIVQVYRERTFLVGAVAAWIGNGLRAGGGAILACNAQNAEAVLARIEHDGVDVAKARAEGRLVVFDADAFLASFMVGGLPRADRFKPAILEAVSGIRQRMRAEGELRAWGEMVDILAKAGNSSGAQALEALWNEVIEATRLRLLCSYELDALHGDAHRGPLEAACAGHSRLLVAEDSTSFERALDRALVEEYGERDAALMRMRLAASRPLDIGMESSEAVLLALQREDPTRGSRVLAAMRREMTMTA